MRLQHLYVVHPHEAGERWRPLFGFPEDARARGADFDAGRYQAAREPLVAERALARHVLGRMEPARAVGAGLDAIAAPDAVFLVHQHDAVARRERGADRT